MDTCLDENVVLALVDGLLSARDLAAAEGHLDVCASCHDLVAATAAATETTPKSNQTRMGRYRLYEQLGIGGSAVVYRAIDTDTEESVALKAVETVSEGALAAIRREIRVLGRLRHPGIIRLLDHGVDAGRPWYAMELLEGDSLAEIKRRMWSVPGPRRAQAGAGQLGRVLSIARALCDPLAFLHAEGVVHRDLKPHNVGFRRDGQPVLVDFGLIGWAPGAVSRETAAVALAAGTPPYMAPEQIARHAVDARADLYALGCMLYELISGHPPFVGPTIGDILRQHLEVAPAPLDRVVAGVPPGVAELVHALLAKTPGDRPGHADDVALALERGGAPAPAGRRQARRTYLYRPGLVGRADQLAQLAALAQAAREGRGGIALVLGESGIGKTYLVTEAARRMDDAGMLVVEGACAPLEVAVDDQAGVLLPFHQLLEKVADRCLILGRAGSDRLIGPRGKILARLLRRLANLPGQEVFPAPREATAVAARDHLLAALRDTLLALAADQPVVLLLDDLQWADELTLRFLATLTIEHFANARLLIVATCRSETIPASLSILDGRPFVHAIGLDRLSDAMLRSVVVEMLAWPAPFEPWLASLVARSDGNPFFVAEYVRAAVTAGTVRRHAGGWVAELGNTGVALPPTLRDLVRGRLDALGATARRLCDAAAVLGRELETELLQATARVDGGEAVDGTAELMRCQIVDELPAGRLRFVHHTLREVAYDDIPDERRRQLHRAAAEAIERRNNPQAGAQLARLGHHWAAAGEPARAYGHLSGAGDHALSIAAYAQARQMFARALEVAGDVPGLPPERVAHAELGLGQAEFGLGDLDGLEDHAHSALTTLGWRRPRSQADWLVLLGRQLARQLGHLALGPRAADVWRSPALRDGALAAGLLSQRYFYLDDRLAMAATVLLSVNCAERSGSDAPVARAYTVMGGLSGLARASTLAARYFAKAHAAALAVDDLGERAMALAVETVMDGSLGQWQPARAAAERLARWIPDLSDPLIRENVITTLCHVELFAGNTAAARAWADQLLASARASCNEQHAMWGLYFLACNHAHDGRWADVEPLLAAARRALEAHPETQSEINCLGLSALASLRLGQPAAARGFADDALARIIRSQPTGFPSLAGYGAVAEVYRELAAHDDDRELARRWRATLHALWAFAALFPVARPLALLEAGHAERARGRHRLAELWLRLSLRSARRLAMPGAIATAEAALLTR